MERIHDDGIGKVVPPLLLCIAITAIQCILGCPINRLFHIRCPGCGLTHAWLSFLSGDIQNAFRYHPLFLFAPLLILLFVWRGYLGEKIRKYADIVMIVFAILCFCARLLAS